MSSFLNKESESVILINSENNELSILEQKQDIVLKNKWVLWFHRVDDDNWKPESYIKIYTLEKYGDLLFIIREIPNITSGMFFIMKEGILPIYEDVQNKFGGYWSLRITKKDSFDIWSRLLYFLCIEGMTKDEKQTNMINGITVSPKINNSIFKIWNNDFKRMRKESLKKEIENELIKWDETFYLQHKPDY